MLVLRQKIHRRDVLFVALLALLAAALAFAPSGVESRAAPNAVRVRARILEVDKMFVPGDRALVVLDLDPQSGEILHANLIDHYRIHVEVLLLALFALLLLLFAGWTGLKALLWFIFTALLIWKIMLPAILDNWDPLWIALGVVTVLTGA